MNIPDGSVTGNYADAALPVTGAGGIMNTGAEDMNHQLISASTQDDNIVWPEKGEPISREAYKELRAYADGRGVHLSGFRTSDVEVGLARDVIDDRAKMLEQYPGLFGGKPFTIALSQHMRADDFAEVLPGAPHILWLNADAYRSKAALAAEYAKLADEGWFVRGTDYRHIIYHEFGHIVEAAYKIDGLKLAREALGLNEADTMVYLSKSLSGYSAGQEGEIVSEMISAAQKQNPPGFVLTFINECNRLIRKKGGYVNYDCQRT
jgi:hypothetical protein